MLNLNSVIYCIVTHHNANLSGAIIIQYASREYAFRESGVAPPTIWRRAI